MRLLLISALLQIPVLLHDHAGHNCTPEHSCVLFISCFYQPLELSLHFAFELDFIRSSSFRVSSHPAKAQSLSAVARLHAHESFWNVLDFTHQSENNGLCAAQAVDLSFFSPFYALFLLFPNPFAGTMLSEIQPCAWQCSCGVLGCSLAYIYLGRTTKSHCLSLPSWLCATLALPLLLLCLLRLLQMCCAAAIAATPFPVFEGVALRWLVRGSIEGCKERNSQQYFSTQNLANSGRERAYCGGRRRRLSSHSQSPLHQHPHNKVERWTQWGSLTFLDVLPEVVSKGPSVCEGGWYQSQRETW